jgi:hypothetical protein
MKSRIGEFREHPNQETAEGKNTRSFCHRMIGPSLPPPPPPPPLAIIGKHIPANRE